MPTWTVERGAEGEIILAAVQVDAKQLDELPARAEVAAKGMRQAFEKEKIEKPFEDMEQAYLKALKAMDPAQLQRTIRSWAAMKTPIQAAISYLDELGYSAKDTNAMLVEGGYKATAVGKTFKELGIDIEDTGNAFDRVAKSVQWAAYRFATTLIIYQAIRKILRTVNEAIQEAIRRYREWARAVEDLNRVLTLHQLSMKDFAGDAEEYIELYKELADDFGLMRAEVAQMANSFLLATHTMGFTNEQLRALITLMVAMAAGAKDAGYTIEQVGKAFEDAILGRGVRALERITGVPLEAKMEALEDSMDEAGGGMDEQAKAALRLSLVLQMLEGHLIDVRGEGVKTGEELAESMKVSGQEIDTTIGRIATNLMDLARAFGRVAGQFLLILGTIVLGITALPALIVVVSTVIGIQLAKSVYELGFRVEALNDALAKLKTIGQDLLVFFGVLPKDVKESKQEIFSFSKILQDLIRQFTSATSAAKAFSSALKDAFTGLGRTLFSTLRDYWRSLGEAQKDYEEDRTKLIAQEIEERLELEREYQEDVLDIEQEYLEKADDLRKRASERIADLIADANERRAQDQEDLNLRLHQMEEDHLLDMKHMYEQYSMDIEEAARKRDAVAIRTLQRRYGLEKGQREEDYQLQRHQVIESWEQRHKQNEENLEREIREIQDALAVELAELEAEKREELDALQAAHIEQMDELKKEYQERRDELKAQYDKQLADLNYMLQQSIVDTLIAEVQKGTITREQAIETAGILAEQYGLNKTEMEGWVTHDLEWLGEWSRNWALAIQSVITNMETLRKALGLGPQFPEGVTVTWHEPEIPHGLRSYAKGGTGIATKPTLVRVGEAGPELFTAIPLAKGGSVIGGLRNYIGGDFSLTIDGNQAGHWSEGFERQIEGVVAGMFREAFQD